MSELVSFDDILGFDWSGGNDEKNRVKHGVSPAEAEQLFFNMPLLVSFDHAHSTNESRYYALGKADSGRELFVVFTVRNDLIRIISARDMSRKEQRIYRS